MHIAESATKFIFVARQQDYIGRIGHQAIRPDLGLRPLHRIREQIEIQIIVAVLEECLFAPIAPLRDMMRQPGKHDAGQAGHAGPLAQLRD